MITIPNKSTHSPFIVQCSLHNVLTVLARLVLPGYVTMLHVATLHQYPFGRGSNLLMVKTKLNPL